MTANVNKWSKMAATNATADPDINWAEGQAPSTVNNSARGNMQGIANYRDDIGGDLTLAGGTTVYTLTTNSVNGAPQLVDGLMVSAVVNAANTGATTLNVDGLGAKNVYKASAAGIAAIGAGDLTVDMHALFQYDESLNAAAGGWVLLNPPGVAPSAFGSTLIAAASAAAARVILATEAYNGVADANATLAAEKFDYIWTSLTAARTATLLAATAYNPGQVIYLTDGSGNASASKTITAIVNPAPGTDTIIGASAIGTANARLQLICDGVSKFYGSLIPASLATSSHIGPGGGRLTLTSATPILTSTVLAAGTVYLAPYLSQSLPIYDGTNMAMRDLGGELSNILANSATGKAGPAAAANNSNYDLFGWDDSGTYRLTRGPLWTSDTARGTGAGTTELVRVKGVWLNANDITNGPAAQRGTYVGTVRTNGTATVDYQLGALAANGTAGIVGVWNMYNRVNVAMFSQDTTNSWTYNTATWRSANASDTLRCSFISGLAEDAISAKYYAQVSMAAAGNPAYVGIGYDANNALAAGCMTGIFTGPVAAYRGQLAAEFTKTNDIGWHFCQAVEQATAATTNTWYGDNNTPTIVQTGLVFNFRA